MEEEALVFAKIAQQPNLDRSRNSSCKVCSSGKECDMFSDSGVSDLTKDIRVAIR